MRTLYLDASAVTKLVVVEDGTDALRTEVAGAILVTSRVAVVEVAKAVARVASDATADEVLEAFVFVELDADLARSAASTGDAWLRALDAIHVASALLLGDELDGFITYDPRQAEAAQAHGLSVLSPGVDRRAMELAAGYGSAGDEWAASDDAGAWKATTADRIGA